MRISDWSSDVCSSDLRRPSRFRTATDNRPFIAGASPAIARAMTATHPPDSQHQGFLALLPAGLRPYALLARFDRPIGWWLLHWPCAWGLALGGGARSHCPSFFWLLIGADRKRVGLGGRVTVRL